MYTTCVCACCVLPKNTIVSKLEFWLIRRGPCPEDHLLVFGIKPLKNKALYLKDKG